MNNNSVSNEQIAHDLAIAIIVNRNTDTPKEALEEYQAMYKDIFNRLNN